MGLRTGLYAKATKIRLISSSRNSWSYLCTVTSHTNKLLPQSVSSALIAELAGRKDGIQQEIINLLKRAWESCREAVSVGSWGLSRSSPCGHEERAFLAEEMAQAKA